MRDDNRGWWFSHMDQLERGLAEEAEELGFRLSGAWQQGDNAKANAVHDEAARIALDRHIMREVTQVHALYVSYEDELTPQTWLELDREVYRVLLRARAQLQTLNISYPLGYFPRFQAK